MALEPLYKNVTFKTKEAFEKWLKKTTYKQINFQDLGQDMQNIWVAKNGEIIHCDFHSSIYNGAFIDLDQLTEFVPIRINLYGKWKRYMGLVVDSIK